MKKFISIAIIFFFFYSCTNKDNSINQIPIEGDQQLTAFGGYQPVESSAIFIDDSAKFVSVKSKDLNFNGKSNYWNYCFLSPTKDSIYFFTNNKNAISIDSCKVIYDGSSIIYENWIDSDIALTTAENNGGKEFREKYINYKISATLFKILVPNTKPTWVISYKSDTTTTDYMIDGVTGEFIGKI